MDYVSTRNRERKVSAAYAIANGIAPDGGLYCPTSFPALTEADWKTLAESDYKGRSALILGKFLTDFTAEELADFAAKAYADEKFGGADTAPVVKLSEGKNLLELWHGPTCAFKDMALQMLPHLLTASLRKTGETRTACILVATSGDTGKAALDGFHDVPGTKIMVYYPVGLKASAGGRAFRQHPHGYGGCGGAPHGGCAPHPVALCGDRKRRTAPLSYSRAGTQGGV